ncbi:MAG: molybdopterin molybdenumtransferase MoeA [Dehalococcoidia bacterium]|nr:molybdopterin molybdenumtransferase MoeA [Dehalococcoidia bacterium]
MDVDGMISVEEARQCILDVVERLPGENRPLEDALGQVLAEDILSELTIPPLDNTAMDGYALRAADTRGASTSSPVELRVIGNVPAGHIFEGEIGPLQAVRIMTGAPIPHGADAVVPFEETTELHCSGPGVTKDRNSVRVYRAVRQDANIRHAGEDVSLGSCVMRAGTELRAAHIGVLASLGRRTVLAYRRPVVAIVSTGNELLALGQPHEMGKIYDSNAYSIAALVQEAGGLPWRLGIARDTSEDLAAKVHAAVDADLLITSAGVSGGDYDVVKDMLLHEEEIQFCSVRMRPGKPLAFGKFKVGERAIPYVGLPGNPVSSMVAFELFGRPAVFKMMAKASWERLARRVTIEDRIENSHGRRIFARAYVREIDGRYYGSLAGSQGSHVLTSMALANALVVCPEDVPVLEPGDAADAIMLGPVLAVRENWEGI